MRALRGRLSGLCQPTYVLDIPGGHGKSPIGPGYLERVGANGTAHYQVTEFNGQRVLLSARVAAVPTLSVPALFIGCSFWSRRAAFDGGCLAFFRPQCHPAFSGSSARMGDVTSDGRAHAAAHGEFS